MALADDEVAAISKLIDDKLKPAPTPATSGTGGPPLVTPVSTTMDHANMYATLATLAGIIITVYHQQTADVKPLPPPVPVVVPADPIQTKLVSDVSELQVRVKVLESAPAPKK